MFNEQEIKAQLYPIALKIVDDTCQSLCAETGVIRFSGKCKTEYPAQTLLEYVVEILQERTSTVTSHNISG